MADRIEQQYGGNLQIGKLFIRFPKKLIAEDVLIKDQLGDTLCFIPEISAAINNMDIKQRFFELGLVRVHDPYIQILEDPGGGYNFDFLIEMLTPKDTAPLPIFLKSQQIRFSNTKFLFKKFGAYSVPDVFNPDNFEITGLGMKLMKFNLNPDSVCFKLRNFHFMENSGFILEDLEGDFVIHDKRVKTEQIIIKTKSSSLNIPYADYLLPSSDSDKSLVQQLELHCRFNRPSVLDPGDIQFFYPDITGSSDRISLLGEFNLNPEVWKAKSAQLSVGHWFGFAGDLKVQGPSDLFHANYNTTVDTLWFNIEQAQRSYLSLLVDLDTLNLPFAIDQVGSVYFKGTMQGGHQDFIAQGDLRSGAGAFRGELSVHPGESPGMLDIFGSYRASLIHLDNFLEMNTGIGLISVDGSLDGIWDGDSIYNIHAETVLPFIQWNEYYYSNVNVKSIIQHKLYEAAVIVNEEYGNLDFYGKVNLREDDPIFDFDVLIEEADLLKLNLYSLDSVANLDLNLHASFSGKEIDDIEGQLWIENSRFSNSRGEIPINQLKLDVSQDFNGKKIDLVSEYIDGRMKGDIYIDELLGQLTAIGGRFLPIRIDSGVRHEDRLNDFSFNINFKNPIPLAQVLASDFIFKENTQLSGFFRYGGRELVIDGSSPQFLIKRKQFTNLRFGIYASGNDLDLYVDLDKIQLDQENSFYNIHFNAIMLPNTMETRLTWQEDDSLKYLSEINPTINFEPGIDFLPRVIIDLPNSTVFFKEKQWELDDSHFEIDQHFFSIEECVVSNQNNRFSLDGVISDMPGDTLSLNFNALDIGIVNQFSTKNKFELAGLVEGDIRFFNLFDGGLFLADLLINDFAVNGEQIGRTKIRSQRAEIGNDILISVLTKRGDISTLQMDGKYSPNTDKLDFLFQLDKLKLSMFDPFLSPVLSGVNGIASGDVRIVGTRQQPVMDGLINVQKGGLRVDYLNTRYTFTHEIKVQENAFIVENLIARDKFGNEAIINGGIKHSNFQDLSLDFRINARDFLFMETDESHGNGYWGTALGTGAATIKGPFKKINIDVSVKTSSGTQFSIPISDQGKAREMDFITYVVHEDPDEDPDLLSFFTEGNKSAYNAKPNKLQLHLDIGITPEAEALLIFDAKVGDVMRGRGNGNIQIDINTLGLFSLNGNFNIDEGEYLFTFQNMPIKRFAINQGSSINWTGKVTEAQLDIDAVYKTKAALYDLILEETDGSAERLPVSCHLLMKGVLERPDLSFAITLPPNSSDFARSQLESLTEDELKKQLFSLLILNRFQPLPGLNSSITRSYGNVGLATTTEVLSSQLNYWLSQISNDFDIGFNYRPGDQISSDEVEVALSTQIFNNRMSINLNGNVDMRSSQDEASQLVGDMEVEYKIIPSGRVRVKAFNRSNKRLIYEYSPYTQGLGLFFREEFDTLGDLFRKYMGRSRNKKTSAKN